MTAQTNLGGVEVLQLDPGAGCHLGRNVRVVGTVGLIEAEDDGVLVVHRVVDVVHPGFVLLQVAGDHGDELFARRRGPTGARAAGAEVLGRSLLMVGSHPPVVPPAAAEKVETANHQNGPLSLVELLHYCALIGRELP